ncbi:rab11 family-interacting protein 5 isoform X1 [Glossina fuscipes]|uniref:Rab11 family-interacting protein 5 isoform X1 n=1 Tax=Glossina fuscipes TaxID=7396 RepID=A0A9C5Z0V9_9MUSC|nr:rab11 family-interacting protein 5 isoform X1 [Glossina fuscipes]
MWSPTHIKVTIRGARGLLTKGKANTNNCFVTIGLGKERYQTSIKDKAESNVTWNEECELKIPDQGNRAELVLTCLHHNNLGLDEFLGQVTLPLNEMDVYDRPRAKWFKLESKPGKEKKNKERGELDVLISFTVKSGSLTDLSKKEKHKSSIGQLASSVGGSLLSIGTLEKRKGIKKFAKSLGSKMHLNGKKKNKDSDDMSYSGSFASIGSPNRVKVIDSEDEDDFQFDNLSQKSSVSSLNMRDGVAKHSPPMGSAGKGFTGGKDYLRNDGSDNLSVDPELEQIENDFSIRTRTLPPPSKPPRITPHNEIADAVKPPPVDEWEAKLYGRHLDIGGSESLKRRSWEPACVPLPTANEEQDDETLKEEKQKLDETKFLTAIENEELTKKHNNERIAEITAKEPEINSPSISEKEEEEEIEQRKQPQQPDVVLQTAKKHNLKDERPNELNLSNEIQPQKLSLISPENEREEFDKFNATFAKFEQRHSAKIFDLEAETNNFLQNETKSWNNVPQPKPRMRTPIGEESKTEVLESKVELIVSRTGEEIKDEKTIEKEKLEEKEKEKEEEIKVEKQRLLEEEKRREAKRREEDQRILNFAKRLVVVEEKDEQTAEANSTEQKNKQIPKETNESSTVTNEYRNVRLAKSRTLNNNENNHQFNNNLNYIKREKQNSSPSTTPSPQTGERIIIGHEKSITQAERRAEISAALAKKYEGKSREELMLIANGMENEALLQRQRVKELEDYLDNLLLRVMETHPKLLQNPYSRTTSAKSVFTH